MEFPGEASTSKRRLVDSDSEEDQTNSPKQLKLECFEQCDDSCSDDVMIVSVEPGRVDSPAIRIEDSDEDLPKHVKTLESPIKVKSEVKSVTRLHDFQEQPVYAQPKKLLTTQEAVFALLSSDLEKSSICTRAPFSVEINAAFIVDLNKFGAPKDVLCDDMGAWIWGGSNKRWISTDSNGFVTFLKPGDDKSDAACFRVWKRYYSLKASPDVKKMVLLLEDHEGDTLNLALVQYYFSQGEHSINVAPHGNARHGQPYLRTMPSVLGKLKKEAKEKTPKRALQLVSDKAGGIVGAPSAGALPRNRQQVKDARRGKQDSDPLYAVMYMCKEGEGAHSDPFIRMINAAPYPMMLLAFDYSLDDLVRFCTSPNSFSILGVDPTFNLGDFDVTVTTYHHLLLQHHNNVEKSPVMLGPLFVHIRKDFSAYHFFSSSLVGQRPRLASLLAFGSDGELALEQAFSATFHKAQHVRCFLHFRQNVERKLRELNVPSSASLEVVQDIMGSPAQLQCGLVDCDSEEKLDEMLVSYRIRWSEIERPYNSPPVFYSWFSKHCRDAVANCMLLSVREKAGLGSPPLPYYTNEVESKNRILKQAVEYKSSQLPDFVEKMRSLMREQRHEIERAILGTGEYKLREEYSALGVSPSKWYKMNADQRLRKIQKFMKAPIQDSASQAATSSDCPLDELSIPQQLKESLWKKAQDLAEDDAAIVLAPGEDSSWCVKSYSCKRPHYVRMAKCGGGFICDEQCVSYKSMKLCSHTVALAIKLECLTRFVRWYRTSKYKPNFSALVDSGKPSTTGRKPPRRGVSKKQAKEIHSRIAEAEDSNIEWEARGHYQQELAGSSTPVAVTGFSGSSQVRPAHVVTPASISTTAAVIVKPSDMHSLQIGSINATVGSPPPLVPASVLYSPSVSRPVCQPYQRPLVESQQPLVESQQPLVESQRPLVESQRPLVESPFWLTFIFGNVSRCNGCKGKICRGVDKKLLPPPNDIVLGHKEYVIFQNSHSGLFEQSREKRNVYYHPWLTCIAPHFSNFDPRCHITVAENVRDKLLIEHKALIQKEFNFVV